MAALRRSLRLGLASLALACSCAEPREQRPNILLVVWDTARADRMSLYGHARDTTPRLDVWAERARVFDDCRSAAPITVSSHAALFTGLLPTESGADNENAWLADEHETLAELLAQAGYRTYAWSANPHISAEENFTQGFSTEEHPWDAVTRERALAIVRKKIAGDRSSELAGRLRPEAPGRSRTETPAWAIKAAGELAAPALVDWLERTDDGQPWFAFVNWMEAHRPLVPPRELRERFLSPAEVERSYALDLSWSALWAYVFRLADLDPADLAVVGGVYDAALCELDLLFADLLAELDERGALANTIVVLTSDHGEHLGEHHLLDHQYSVHEPLLRVPLVLAGPGIAPGRDARPVSNHDLFPTLLALAGLSPALAPSSGAQSLLAPLAQRVRLAEYPAPFAKAFEDVARDHPSFDPTPWQRSLRAIDDGDYVLLAGSDGRRELYRARDESTELSAREPAVRERLERALADRVATLRLRISPADEASAPSADHRTRLEDLGYSGRDGGD